MGTPMTPKEMADSMFLDSVAKGEIDKVSQKPESRLRFFATGLRREYRRR